MLDKYKFWNGTRKDLIDIINKLEQNEPHNFKMRSKNTGNYISINNRRVQQFIDNGLIPSPVKGSKDKQYNEEHIIRYVATIKLKNEGYTLKQIRPLLLNFNLNQIKSKILKLKDGYVKIFDETIKNFDQVTTSKNLIKLGREEGKVLTSIWTKFAVTKWFNAEINNRKLQNLTNEEINVLMSALKEKLINHVKKN